MTAPSKKTNAQKIKSKINKLSLSLKITLYLILTLVLLFFLFAPYPQYTQGFENINEVIADSTKKNELALPDGYIATNHPYDHQRPSWRTFHKKNKTNWLKQKVINLLCLLGIKKRPFWSPQYFKYLMQQQINEKKKNGYQAEYVLRLTPSKNSRFIVWGDLSGAYHSLSRDIKKLISLKIMDNNLKLLSVDDCLIFTGDVCSRSPFIMELLTLIMKLEEKNPNQVFFLAGNIERRETWQTYGLGEELQLKASLVGQKQDLYNLVEKYFQTLPLGIYVSIPPHESNNFIRLSHFSMLIPAKDDYAEFVELLDDAYYAKDLLRDRKSNTIKIINLHPTQTNPQPNLINVKAIIKSIFKAKAYQKHDGLQRLIPDKSATAWTLLSGPTIIVSYCFDFYNDAFAILQLAQKFENWTITLYYRDIRAKEDFKTKVYNFMSGEKLSPEPN